MPPPKESILIIEDEEDIRRALKYNLGREGYSVSAAGDGETGLEFFRKEKPDLVLLDIMLDKMDGREVLRQIRKDSEAPVIFLTAKGKEFDRILGLRLGADDYIVKPFSMGELIARVENVLRRISGGSGKASRPFEAGEMQVNFDVYEVRIAGREIKLTPKEFALLRLLIQAKGKVLSRATILERVWGADGETDIDTRTVDQHVARLRRKLRSERGRIATVSTVGYKFLMGRLEPESAASRK